jgi:hypothetical protein
MRSSSRVIGILSALAFLVVPAPAIAAEAKTVIELFTSQGCNSCPPADRLLGELAADDRLIALSLPVDYWDYLGWRDTLALHSHTIRQKAYAETRGDRQVYTPQVVINGGAQTIGSDRYAIEGAITKAQAKNKLTVPVSLKLNATHIEIEIGLSGIDLDDRSSAKDAGGDHARRESRQDHHLPQCRTLLATDRPVERKIGADHGADRGDCRCGCRCGRCLRSGRNG